MQRLTTAWRLFINGWKEYKPGYPVQAEMGFCVVKVRDRKPIAVEKVTI